VSPTLHEDLDLALDIAEAADRVSMSRYLAADLVVDRKPDTTPVTEADTRTESVIRKMLSRRRPDDAILGEEFGQEGSRDRCWIIDPIDGTANFLRGVPVWATLIGLEADGEIVLGVVSAPALGRRWWAARGRGSHTRDVDGTARRLHSSVVSTLADASFSFSDEDGWAERGALAGLRRLIGTCWRTRAYGDFWSHMMVAEGAVDIAAEPSLMPWDMAALLPIITEAGGRVSGYGGADPMVSGSLVSTNSVLHDEVLAALAPSGDAP
jgi:histidinol-phosphatase